jgi:tetratricopeptide (TPR) repeat protein
VVGAVFRSARELQRLSQHQVSALTGGVVSRATISDIERGLSLPGLETLVSLSRVLGVDPLEVLERIDLDVGRAAGVAEQPFEALMDRAEERFLAAGYRAALSIYDELAERLLREPLEDGRDRSEREARVEINRAVALILCGAPKAAEAAVSRATQLSEGVPRLQAQAYMVLGSLQAREGLHALAEVTIERAVALTESAGADLKARAWSLQAGALYRAERLEEARQAWLHARKFAIQAGERRALIGIEGNLGLCLVRLGRRKPARARLTRAVQLAREQRDRSGEALWLVDMGLLLLDEGDLDGAERHAEAALRLARKERNSPAALRADLLGHRVARRHDPSVGDARRLKRIRRQRARLGPAALDGEALGVAFGNRSKGASGGARETLVTLAGVTHVDPRSLLELAEEPVGGAVDASAASIDALLARLKAHYFGADYQGMLALCDGLEEQLTSDPPEDDEQGRELRAEVHLQRALALRGRSELKMSEETAKRAIQLSEGFPTTQTRAYLLLNTIQVASGLLALAEVTANKALELSTSCSASLQGQAWLQKGNCLYAARRYEEARQTYMHARDFSRQARDDNHIAILEGNIGTCLQDLGRRKQAKTRFEKAVALARRCGNHNFEAFWLIALGHFHLDGGEPDEAERCAVAALRIARRRDRVLLVFRGEWLRHLVVQRRRPGARDTRRLNRLKELYPRVRQEATDDAVRDFSAAMVVAEDPERNR